MQKGAAQLLLIFAVIIIVLAGGVFLYQGTKKNIPLQLPQVTPVKQIEFNEYSNQDLGFYLKTSKDLTIKTDSEEEFNKRGNGNFRKNFKGYVGYEPGKALGAVVVLDKSSSYDANPFSIWVFDNPNNLTIDAWFKNYWYYPFVWGVFDYTSKGHITPDTEATISGQPAKSKIVAYQPGKPKFVYVAIKEKMYLIRLFEGEGDKILSTFKLSE